MILNLLWVYVQDLNPIQRNHTIRQHKEFSSI